MSELKDDIRRYLNREIASGRGRALLNEHVAEMAAAPEATPEAAPTSAKKAAKPVASEPAPAPTAEKPTAKKKHKTFGPLPNLRDDAFVSKVADALAPVQNEAEACRECELCETRTKVVFGTGSTRSGIVFIGEAPGAQEDKTGVPFVGRAGQLLDRILVAAGIAREDVYICNVLKCRPPNNRDPQPTEVAACADFLRRQLEALQPRVLCALGLHAARWLLKTTQPMGRLRGQVLDYQGIPTIATYHPAALLRNPKLKAPAWEDFQLLRQLAIDAGEKSDS